MDSFLGGDQQEGHTPHHFGQMLQLKDGWHMQKDLSAQA
jgi:hypothetical protein